MGFLLDLHIITFLTDTNNEISTYVLKKPKHTSKPVRLHNVNLSIKRKEKHKEKNVNFRKWISFNFGCICTCK